MAYKHEYQPYKEIIWLPLIIASKLCWPGLSTINRVLLKYHIGYFSDSKFNGNK